MKKLLLLVFLFGCAPTVYHVVNENPTTCTQPTAIVYSASWCGSCHEAVAYFKEHNVCVIDKDEELDQSAREEMWDKLDKNNLKHGTIPVVDYKNVIMLGFDKNKLNELIGK